MERANSPQAKDESESTTKKSPPIESTTRKSTNVGSFFYWSVTRRWSWWLTGCTARGATTNDQRLFATLSLASHPSVEAAAHLNV
jgi:hypothetical protein